MRRESPPAAPVPLPDGRVQRMTEVEIATP